MAGGLTPASPVSPGAEDTQTAYIVMVVISLLLAIALVGGLLSAVRGRGAAPEPRRTRGTSSLQTRVAAGLSVLALIVFVFGIVMTESSSEVEGTGPDGLLTAQTDLQIPADAKPLNIRVSGQQWLWRYEYPDGTFSYYEMVVPVDTAVVLDIESIDVLHTWWVPALGGMADAVPGSSNKAWFKADETGSFEGTSTTFSGPGYPVMRARVTVVEPDEYQAWLGTQAEGIQEAQAAVKAAVEDGTAPGVELETGGDSGEEPTP